MIAFSQNKNGETYHTYGYTNAGWSDLLTSFDGGTITYDAIGNPLTYHDGKAFTWTAGRKLSTVTDGDSNYTYAYDGDGNRISKTVDGQATDYYYIDGKLLGLKKGQETLLFLYDETDTVYGLIYNGTPYFYDINLQGDIIGIYDQRGNHVVSYTYDIWGALLAIHSDYHAELALFNPLLYRGYYYDFETGFYYLQSRYYDPTVGRFINADAVDTLVATLDDVTDKNLFAYCDNNPVMRVDDDGEFWKEVGLAVAITAGAVAIGALIVATGGIAVVAVAGGGTAFVASSTAVTAIGVATVTGKVAYGGIVFYATAATVEQYASNSKDKVDPYARPGQKKQGRERKNKARRKDTWKPKSKPKKPKKHTPGKDHRRR